MAATNDRRPESSTRRGGIPLSVRKRYGYPLDYRSRDDGVMAELAQLRRRVERLERRSTLVEPTWEPGR